MNRKTLSRLVVLCLVVAMLATVVVGSSMAAEQQVSAGSQCNFTSFAIEHWGEFLQPAAIACDGCSGGGGGPA